MPRVVHTDWLGRRVVVRRLLAPPAGPGYADALGDLVALSEADAVVDTRSGPVTVARRDIVLARLVLPAAADQLRLEAVAARGWRAAEIVTSEWGWLLRADHGWTGRANSALALRSLRRPLDPVLAEVADWYAQRNLPPRIQVPLPAAAALDGALGQRGWTTADDVTVLTARLDLLPTRTPARRPLGLRLEVSDRPAPDWLGAYRYRGEPLPPGAADLLARHDRVAFLTVWDEADGEVVAVGRAAVDDEWLGLTALDVAPGHRRRGVASAIVAAAAAWAADQGARRCYLQVSDDNRGALAFYSALGFHPHHSYRYRDAPTI